MTELCFVLSPGQNHFFFELAEALRDELEAEGVDAVISTDGFPELGSDGVYALLPPHEFFVLEGARLAPSEAPLERTILISAEQPTTVHFQQNVALAPRAGALFDINARAVRAYRRRGFRARHLRLGYTKSWDHFGDAAGRELDAIFLGAYTQRRGRVLAGGAETLARLRTRFVVSDNSRPNTATSPGFLSGAEKWEALRAARILLNVHQGDEPYFEWHRALQAIHCGTVVLTETSTDIGPLEPGVHLETAAAGDLAAQAAALAGDEDRRRRLASQAYDLIREALPLRASARALAEAADEIRTSGRRPAGVRARAAAGLAKARVRAATWRGARLQRPPSLGGTAAFEVVEAIAEDGAGRVLLSAPGLELLPRGLESLSAALDADAGASFAFGLVATAEKAGILNPFAWEPGREAFPPLLVTAAALREATASLPGPEDLAAAARAVVAAGTGVNAQAFAARRR